MSPPIAAVNQARPERDEALREILRGRLDLLGPVTAELLAAPLGLDAGAVQLALLQLEADGTAIRGAWTAPGTTEWCDRRLLARMHRATRDKLRADIQPVPPAQFMRFLFRWHQLATADDDERREDEGGLADVLHQLEGHAAPAAAWEEDLLAARVKDYEPAMLDKLCAVGRIVWWRPADGMPAPGRVDAPRSGPIRSTPILLCERDALPHWQDAVLRQAQDDRRQDAPALSGKARAVLEALQAHGASFFADLQRDARLLGEETEQALAELVAQGLVTCDTFA